MQMQLLCSMTPMTLIIGTRFHMPSAPVHASNFKLIPFEVCVSVASIYVMLMIASLSEHVELRMSAELPGSE